ncbi:Pisatin demethylase [Lecanosticta acicola]|uniref:Pisatin demethylase n=1 Tax=Lecanosticta acicola TaxID=111012 RepID=A0AAI8YW05_9PEZI|nr:Pisatin demethylase [Lecanosticta acicola]
MDSLYPRLTLPAVALSLFAVFLSYVVIGSIVNYRKLSQFKGPPLAALSRLWIFREECAGRLPKSQEEALRKYGSPARIGPNLLVTDDPDLIRHMNAPGSKWTRSTWYDAMKLDPRQHSVFSTRDEKLHAELKAKEATGYNGRDIPGLESDMDEKVLEMLDLIKSSYAGKIMDFADVARFFTLDVLSTVAFGRPFGFMAANEDLYDYNKISAGFMVVLGLQCNHHGLYRFLSQDWIQALVAPKVTDEKGWGPLLAFARKAVSERYGPDAKAKKDMLGSFVEKGLDQTQCEVEAFLQIMAGSDSTTDVLRSTVFLLAGNPPAYIKLRDEIDTAVKAGVVAPGLVIKYTEARKLPYLRACILESLRLFSPLFGLKSKSAPEGGENVNGVFFPEGSEVCICDNAFMRRKDIFGDDAEIYRPERFVDCDEELANRRFRAVECAFGTGRYMCLGKHIAQMELHKAVFELMRNFDFQIADATKGITLFHHNVHVASDMNMVARSRV